MWAIFSFERGGEMYWESLPSWIWAIYYILFLVTISVAVFSIIRNKLRKFSVLTVVITLMMPIIAFLNSVGRKEGIDEWQHLVMELQQGALWAIFILIAAIYLIVWWGGLSLKICVGVNEWRQYGTTIHETVLTASVSGTKEYVNLDSRRSVCYE